MGKNTYSDGYAVENYLIELFKRNPSLEELNDILDTSVSWPIKYHLSPDRHNLLSNNFIP